MTFFAIMVSEEAKEQMKKKKQQQEQGQLPPQDSEAIQNQQNLKHLQPSHPGEFIYIYIQAEGYRLGSEEPTKLGLWSWIFTILGVCSIVP